MARPKETLKDGVIEHYSVGALIERGNEYLLIDRAKVPFGYGCVSGHVDEDETPEQALVREVLEEVGLGIESYELLFEDIEESGHCSRGSPLHHWSVYKCTISGEPKTSDEVKSVGWYNKDEIGMLSLEPAWERFFREKIRL